MTPKNTRQLLIAEIRPTRNRLIMRVMVQKRINLETGRGAVENQVHVPLKTCPGSPWSPGLRSCADPGTIRVRSHLVLPYSLREASLRPGRSSTGRSRDGG